MKAIIVAAGRVLRMHPITDGIAKCLLKVGKKRDNKEGRGYEDSIFVLCS